MDSRGWVPQPRTPIAVDEVGNLADAACQSNSKIHHNSPNPEIYEPNDKPKKIAESTFNKHCIGEVIWHPQSVELPFPLPRERL